MMPEMMAMPEVEFQLRQNIATLEAMVTQLRDENAWLREQVAKVLEELMAHVATG